MSRLPGPHTTTGQDDPASSPAPRSAGYFDQWYADMAASPVKDEIQQRHLGLPPHLLPNSSLPRTGFAEIEQALGLGPGTRLLDSACGRGSVGLELAGRTGADLVGVDFSAVALQSFHGGDVKAVTYAGSVRRVLATATAR